MTPLRNGSKICSPHCKKSGRTEMHMKKTRTWKKLTALMIAALLILSVLPAALALPDDWTSVSISLNWTDADGNLQGPVRAYPLAEEPGSFFAYLPPDSSNTVCCIRGTGAGLQNQNRPECRRIQSRRYCAGSDLDECRGCPGQQLFSLYRN